MCRYRPSVCLRQLLLDAIDAGTIPPCDVDDVAYIITTLKSSYIHSKVLVNELGVGLPASFAGDSG